MRRGQAAGEGAPYHNKPFAQVARIAQFDSASSQLVSATSVVDRLGASAFTVLVAARSHQGFQVYHSDHATTTKLVADGASFKDDVLRLTATEADFVESAAGVRLTDDEVTAEDIQIIRTLIQEAEV